MCWWKNIRKAEGSRKKCNRSSCIKCMVRL